MVNSNDGWELGELYLMKNYIIHENIMNFQRVNYL